MSRTLPCGVVWMIVTERELMHLSNLRAPMSDSGLVRSGVEDNLSDASKQSSTSVHSVFMYEVENQDANYLEEKAALHIRLINSGDKKRRHILQGKMYFHRGVHNRGNQGLRSKHRHNLERKLNCGLVRAEPQVSY